MKLRKLSALLMALPFILPVFAASGTEDDPWLIGKDDPSSVTATLDNGTLFVNGEGEMADFETLEERPWYDVIGDISYVMIDSDVTSIGKNAFAGVGNDEDEFDIFFGDSVASIGDSAFEGAHFGHWVIVTLPGSVETIGSRAFADTGITRTDFMCCPAIAEDAYAGVSMEAFTICGSAWSDENRLPYGGELTYKTYYIFSYEVSTESGEMEGEGSMYVPEDEPLDYDASAWDESCRFISWELLEGKLDGFKEDDPVLHSPLTGNVKVRMNFAYEEESEESLGDAPDAAVPDELDEAVPAEDADMGEAAIGDTAPAADVEAPEESFVKQYGPIIFAFALIVVGTAVTLIVLKKMKK